MPKVPEKVGVKISELEKITKLGENDLVPLNAFDVAGEQTSKSGSINALRQTLNLENAYLNVQAGLADTIDGELFFVYEDSTKKYALQYLRNAGSAQPVVGYDNQQVRIATQRQISAASKTIDPKYGADIIPRVGVQLATEAGLTSDTTPEGRLVTVPNVNGVYNHYSIIPNSGVLGDGDILIDRVDGLQAKINVQGVINLQAFAKTGRTDQAVIQKALDYAAKQSGHWVIAVPSKNKDNTPWGFTNLKVGSRTVLQGHGGRLRFADNICTSTSNKYYLLEAMNTEGVWLDNLEIDGNGANNKLFDVADILTVSGDGARITNCLLTDAPDSAIMFSSVVGGLIHRNQLVGGTDCGIYANSSLDGASYDNLISSNVIRNFASTGIGFKRFFADAVATDNYIDNCGNGVTFEYFSEVSADCYPKRIQLLNTQLRRIGFNWRAGNIAERGVSISKGKDITIANLMAHDVSGNILYLGTVEDVVVSNAQLRGYPASPHSAGNNGVYIDDATRGALVNVSVNNVANRAADIQKVTNTSLIGGDYVTPANLSAMAVRANCAFAKFAPNLINGSMTAATKSDLDWYAGATGIIERHIQASQTGVARYGYQTVSAGAGNTPVSKLTPRFIGEEAVTLADNAYWKSTGLTSADWVKISN